MKEHQVGEWVKIQKQEESFSQRCKKTVWLVEFWLLGRCVDWIDRVFFRNHRFPRRIETVIVATINPNTSIYHGDI